MSIAECICLTIVIIVLAFTGLCIGLARYNYLKLEEENEMLKNELRKARSRRVKSEYKKVKEVK